MPLTQADMADQLCTMREMISRTFKTFEGLGLIEIKRGEIVIRNRAELEARMKE